MRIDSCRWAYAPNLHPKATATPNSDQLQPKLQAAAHATVCVKGSSEW